MRGGSPQDESQPAPVGFKIFLAIAALYLLLRLVQMAGWLLDWIR